METVPRTIDIRKVIRTGNSKFFRNMPGFLITGIEKLICQKEMNETIYRHRDKTGLPFIEDVLRGWNVRTETTGLENIPRSGRFIFVSNHPLGAVDALTFLTAIGKYYPDVVTPANEMISCVTNMQPVLFGINVYGRNSRETAEKLNALFGSDRQVMMFPSGEVSRRKKGIIRDQVWQKSFITRATQFKRDIVPVHISGRNSNLFYFVANLRSFLGIKMFIESALLPREMVRQWNSTVTLTFGNVIPWSTFGTIRTPAEWAQHVKEIVYKLGE